QEQASKLPCVAFTGNGQQMALGVAGEKVAIWDLESGKGKKPFTTMNETVQSLAFSPDAQLLAVAGQGDSNNTFLSESVIEVVETRIGLRKHLCQGLRGKVHCLAFRPAVSGQPSTLLAAAGDARVIKLWELPRTDAATPLTPKVNNEFPLPGSPPWSPPQLTL